MKMPPKEIAKKIIEGLKEIAEELNMDVKHISIVVCQQVIEESSLGNIQDDTIVKYWKNVQLEIQNY
jgi:predicted nucleic acid-binding protein